MAEGVVSGEVATLITTKASSHGDVPGEILGAGPVKVVPLSGMVTSLEDPLNSVVRQSTRFCSRSRLSCITLA